MTKKFSISGSVYVIPLVFAVSSMFFEQFDWLHTLLLFCLALCVDVDFGKKIVIYSKEWTSEN